MCQGDGMQGCAQVRGCRDVPKRGDAVGKVFQVTAPAPVFLGQKENDSGENHSILN